MESTIIKLELEKIVFKRIAQQITQLVKTLSIPAKFPNRLVSRNEISQ